MKLKGLAAMTLLVLGCGAAFGQTYSFGFGTACDFETFTVSGIYVAGTHNLTKYCGNPVDAVLVGFKGNIPATSGAAITGSVVMMADNVYDAFGEQFGGCQIELVSRTKASSKKIGWVNYINCGDGVEYIIDYGYLTTQLGAAGTKRTSVSAAFDAIRTGAKNKQQ